MVHSSIYKSISRFFFPDPISISNSFVLNIRRNREDVIHLGGPQPLQFDFLFFLPGSGRFGTGRTGLRYLDGYGEVRL